jgi:putative restriction endonuclease
MTTKELFKLHLESQNSQKTGKAASYVRALDLLSGMLRAVPKGFADCLDIWNVHSVSRLQALYEVANEQKHLGTKSCWNISGIPPSYLQNGYCTAALREFQNFLIESAHFKKLMTTYQHHSGSADDLAVKLNKELSYPKALLKSLDQVGKEALREMKIRVNQRAFRGIIFNIYGNSCCITGIDIPAVNRASHILGWAESEPTRMDPRNGLCLSATYDAAFDRHLISLDEDFRLLISRDIKDYFSSSVVQAHFHDRHGQKINMPKHFIPLQSYLEAHRAKGRFL